MVVCPSCGKTTPLDSERLREMRRQPGWVGCSRHRAAPSARHRAVRHSGALQPAAAFRVASGTARRFLHPHEPGGFVHQRRGLVALPEEGRGGAQEPDRLLVLVAGDGAHPGPRDEGGRGRGDRAQRTEAQHCRTQRRGAGAGWLRERSECGATVPRPAENPCHRHTVQRRRRHAHGPGSRCAPVAHERMGERRRGPGSRGGPHAQSGSRHRVLQGRIGGAGGRRRAALPCRRRRAAGRSGEGGRFVGGARPPRCELLRVRRGPACRYGKRRGAAPLSQLERGPVCGSGIRQGGACRRRARPGCCAGVGRRGPAGHHRRVQRRRCLRLRRAGPPITEACAPSATAPTTA